MLISPFEGIERVRKKKHRFKLILTFGIAISGLLRYFHCLHELAIQQKARGRILANVANDPRTVSILFTGGRDVRKPWTAEGTAEYLTIPHSKYLRLELRRLNKEGSWSSVASPHHREYEFGPATHAENE